MNRAYHELFSSGRLSQGLVFFSVAASFCAEAVGESVAEFCDIFVEEGGKGEVEQGQEIGDIKRTRRKHRGFNPS